MMNEMMNKMMEQMMPKMMEAMMASMMNSMMSAFDTPAVAPAEVEKPKSRGLSKEEYLAMAEVVKTSGKPATAKDLSDLDIEENGTYRNQVRVSLTKSVPHELWVANHLSLSSKFQAKACKGGWTFPDKSTAYVALGSYQVIKEMTPELKALVEKYDKEQAKKKAEYYASKA